MSLVVRIYDGYHVPPDHLATARTTVERIMMNGAGVEVTWPACPCLRPVGSRELIIRIAAATPTTPATSLGVSLIDVVRRTGTLATVFADRVHALAASAGVDTGELLGRVIAHELTHLLIGTRDHTAAGLMRGGWKVSELTQQRASDWLLTRADGVAVREAVWRRASESPPTLMAVDADGDSEVTTQ